MKQRVSAFTVTGNSGTLGEGIPRSPRMAASGKQRLVARAAHSLVVDEVKDSDTMIGIAARMPLLRDRGITTSR